MSITKGPWKWTDDRQGNRWGRKELEPRVISGTVEGLIDISDEDAALIEAAPDLLEALEACISAMKNDGRRGGVVLEQAKEALEKARGKS